MMQSQRPNEAGNRTYKKQNEKTRPPTLLDLEESSDDSDSWQLQGIHIRLYYQ